MTGHARLRDQAGFTVIELMIALALTGIVTTQLLLLWTAQHRNYMQQERVVETQQDMRIVTDVLIDDLRMAGFMVPQELAAGSVDGGTANPDVLCMSDPEGFVESTFDTATERFEAATVNTTVTGGVASVPLLTTTMDIDGDGNDDFAAGGGILISDGAGVHCGDIVSVSAGTVTFSPATPSTLSLSPLSTFAVPALVYQLTGTTLTRNGTVISDQVDDIQVEWWVDTNSDGDMTSDEFPIHDLDGEDTSRLRLARLYLTTLSSVPDASVQGLRTAAANRTAGTADQLRRRRAVTDARLRNAR
jgi:prepilin-type N-terminal cleavage/methylation domain-containing protein